MAFWTDPYTEPKRVYRWLMRIDNIPMWIVKTAERPSTEVTETEHNYINHTFYYPARVKWSPINITLVDPASPDATATMMNRIFASGYNYPTDPNNTSTISKAKAVAALGSVKLQMLGVEDGEVIEEWHFRNAWIQNIKNGALDYTNDDLVNLELTIRFDYAKLTKSGRIIQPSNQLKSR